MIFATVLGYVANIVSNISAARKDFQGMYCSAFISSRKFDMYYFIFLVSPNISPPLQAASQTFMKLPIKYFI